MIVGGGDSAVESALILASQNKVILSYRGDAFSRLKPKNSQKITEAAALGQLDLMLNTNLVNIGRDEVTLSSANNAENLKVENDLVYIFAGGELPTQFLTKSGIQISTRYGETVLKHK